MAQLPTPSIGILLTHFIVSDDVERSRRFYTEVLGGETVFHGDSSKGEPSIIALANGWVTINVGGGPTPRSARRRGCRAPTVGRSAISRLDPGMSRSSRALQIRTRLPRGEPPARQARAGVDELHMRVCGRDSLEHARYGSAGRARDVKGRPHRGKVQGRCAREKRQDPSVTARRHVTSNSTPNGMNTRSRPSPPLSRCSYWNGVAPAISARWQHRSGAPPADPAVIRAPDHGR
jgi:catechol 2,3-dioxygenase-like lactoylglutathione lyase family enzyme